MKNLKLNIQVILVAVLSVILAIFCSYYQLTLVRSKIFAHGIRELDSYASIGVSLIRACHAGITTEYAKRFLSSSSSNLKSLRAIASLKLSDEEEAAVEIFQSTFFSKEAESNAEYIVFDRSGRLLTDLPLIQKKIGDNILNMRDDSGVSFVKSLMRRADLDSVKNYTPIHLHLLGKPIIIYAYAHLYAPWGWYVVSYVDNNEFHDRYRNDLDTVLFSFVMCVFIVGVLIFYLQRNVISPLSCLHVYVQRMIADDLDFEISSKDKEGQNEISLVTLSLDNFKEKIKENRALDAERKALKKQYVENQRDSLNKVASQFENQVGQALENIFLEADKLQDVQNTVSCMLQSGKEHSEAMLVTSENSSGNVQSVASAAEELSESIGEITSQVTQSTRMTQKAVEEASEINEKVKSLNDAATRVGEVVELIAGIAEQTNLLALNATIEAARAGDAGKGFTVVASEVKNLANRTAKATEEISLQISGMQKATESSVHAIAKITQIVGDINNTISGIAAAVEEQSAATQEISRNAEFASNSTHETQESVKSMIEASDQLTDMTNNMLGISSSLQQHVETLKRSTNSFLETLSEQSSQIQDEI